MMAGRGRTSAAAGGPARHIPVMLSEVLAALEPKDGEIIVDGTFGAGGYSRGHPRSGRLQGHRHRSRSRGVSPERARWSRPIPERLVVVLGRYSEMQ